MPKGCYKPNSFKQTITEGINKTIKTINKIIFIISKILLFILILSYKGIIFANNTYILYNGAFHFNDTETPHYYI